MAQPEPYAHSVEGFRQLYVNDGTLEASQVGPLRPTDPNTTDIAEIRRRLHEDGYVFLKSLLPRDDVLKTRGQYFEYLSSTGLLKPGSAPVDGIFDSAKNKDDYPRVGAGSISEKAMSARFMDLAIKAHAEPWYKDDFCQHPKFNEYICKVTYGLGREYQEHLADLAPKQYSEQ